MTVLVTIGTVAVMVAAAGLVLIAAVELLTGGACV
jgi:hypothetical protein